MKKVIFLLLFAMCLSGLYAGSEVFGRRGNVVEPYEIREIHPVINKSLGSVSGYIIFLNEEGEQCVTAGIVQFCTKDFDEKTKLVPRIKRGSKRYHLPETLIKYEEVNDGYEDVPQVDFVGQISFSPEDFRYLDNVLALPFTLDPGLVEEGDTIQVFFGNVTSEVKVRGVRIK